MAPPDMLAKILRGTLYTLAFLVIAVVALLAPIDWTPLHERQFYRDMMGRLDTLAIANHPPAAALKAGWARVNITPDRPMPMAGYNPRDRFTDVHDSLYVSVMAFDNGAATAFIISADLLLFPPELRKTVDLWVKRTRFANAFLYFGAVHTHNGVGGWENTMVGEFAVGKYDPKWVSQTADKILSAMEDAHNSARDASLAYFEADGSEWVANRLAPDAPVDGLIRGITINRIDSARAMLVTYSAHPTSISSKSHSLSADYPGSLRDELAASGESDFTLFMAGMVGSHKLKGFGARKDFEITEWAGASIAQKIRDASATELPGQLNISTARLPVMQGPSQLRITQNIHVRDWVFRSAAGSLEGEICVLALGDVVLLGTSCDFSGELFARDHYEQLAVQHGKELIITSFNGYYTGYITYDEHYEKGTKDEVTTMNWVGPYFGAYYTDIITRLLDKL